MNLAAVVRNVGDSSNLQKVAPHELLALGLVNTNIYTNPQGDMKISLSDGKKIVSIKMVYPPAALPKTQEEFDAIIKEQFSTYQLYLGDSMGYKGNTTSRPYLMLAKKSPDFTPQFSGNLATALGISEMATAK